MTLDLTLNAHNCHMAQKVKLSSFESLKLWWSWSVSMVQTSEGM